MTGAASRISTYGAGTRDYLRDHWYGRQSLILSFWVNMALLRAAILGAEGYLLAPFVGHPYAGPVTVLLFFVVAHVVVYAWQVVGLLRALERHQSAYGSLSVVWAVHFGILMSLIFTFVGVFVSVQNAFMAGDRELLSDSWDRERAARYALTLSDDGAVIHLTGSFELGITKNLTALLERHPGVTAIVLASPGGNTYEGRGVARIVRDRGLDSTVFTDCFSVCTLAFVAGATRTLGPAGRLGFHQYGLDADYPVPFVDIAGEQDSDRQFLESREIAETFLKQVFEAPHADLWIPDTDELLAAGVVHRIAARPPEP